jgi:hypothetical protein
MAYTIDELIDMTEEQANGALELSTDAEVRTILTAHMVEGMVDGFADMNGRERREFIEGYLTETHRGYNDWTRDELVKEIKEILTEAREF